MSEEVIYLIEAKAKILGVSTKAVKAAMAMKCLLDEEAADDPFQVIRDIGLGDIH